MGGVDFVALLAEGVDRNFKRFSDTADTMGSPSSRRAWIEILSRLKTSLRGCSRPPHGGRG